MCPSTDARIKKPGYIYTMEYYSVIKRNDVRSFFAMSIDPEVVIQE